MEAYLQAFANFKQSNWGRLLIMVRFADKNAMNANIGYIPFELNYGYYFCVFFEENTNP